MVASCAMAEKKVWLSDNASAEIVVLAARTKKMPNKATRKQMETFWKEGLDIAFGEGEEGIDYWLGRSTTRFGRGRAAELTEAIKWARNSLTQPEVVAAGKVGAALPGDDARPDIEVTAERHEVEAEAIAALAGDANLFARGSVLVEVVVESREASSLAGGVSLRHVRGIPRVLVLSEPAVGTRLTAQARFHLWRKDRSGESSAVSCHPPEWLIRAIATRQHWPGIRPLLGVAACPYVKADGTLSPSDGYDFATGTLVSGPPLPALGVPPTQADARDAAETLKRLVGQFPFESPADFGVWLAALLTAIQRPTIEGPTPGIAVNGNRAGTGKGLLIDLIGIIASGSRVPTSNYPSDPAEAQKVKVALALDATALIHFDNLVEGQAYGSGPLDSALTSTVIDDRILGTSRKTGPTPLRPVWFLSGNNVSPGKDAYRRWLPINLVTERESPEERDDLTIRDVRGHAVEHRGTYLAAALTILRAHALAGRPSSGWPPLGSFESWDATIRDAVWFATGLDCCATRRRAAEDSPERVLKLALLQGWRELPRGDVGLTVAEAVKLVEPVRGENSSYPDLEAAFCSLSRSGRPNSRPIALFIRGMKGAVFDGLKFVAGPRTNAGYTWKVMEVYARRPEPLSMSSVDGADGADLQTNSKRESDSIHISIVRSGEGVWGPGTSALPAPSTPITGVWTDPGDPMAQVL